MKYHFCGLETLYYLRVHESLRGFLYVRYSHHDDLTFVGNIQFMIQYPK